MFRSILIAMLFSSSLATTSCKRRAQPEAVAPAVEAPAAAPAAAAPEKTEADTPAPEDPKSVLKPFVPTNDPSRYAFVDGGTINGDPAGPRAEAVRAILDSANEPLSKCATQAPKPKVDTKVTIKYVIDNSGAVKATPEGALEPATLECMKGVVESLKFASFSGQAIPGQLFVLVNGAGTAAPASASPSPAGAPK